MPDLREWKYTCIPVVLQCALADVEQLAYTTIVQPIGMLALFPDALWQVSARLSISVLNLAQFESVMIKYPIFFVVLFVIPYCFASYRTFLPAKVGKKVHTW